MLKIRLQRVGRKHDPSFRIVLTDSKNGPRSGKFLEILGNYDPKKDVRKVDGERVKELMSTGAQVSDTVYNILVNEKVLDGKKINVLPKKSPIIDEEKIKAEAEAVEAKAKASSSAKAMEDKEEEAKEEEKSTEEIKEEKVSVEEVKEETVEGKKEEVKEGTPAEEKKEEEK